MCNNSSLKAVVEPSPFGSTMSHYSLILVPEITFWSFSTIYSWKWVESEWCCFMCIFRLRSFFSSLLQRVQGVGRSKCLALACLLALLRSANWLPHILHSNLENKTYNQGARWLMTPPPLLLTSDEITIAVYTDLLLITFRHL